MNGNVIQFPNTQNSYLKSKMRARAFLIDNFVILLLTKLFQSSYLKFMTTYFKDLHPLQKFKILASVDKTFFGTFLVLSVGYYFASYFIGEGKTLGLKVTKLQVTPKDFTIVHPLNSSRLGVGSALLRVFGQFLNMVFFSTLLLAPLSLLSFIRRDSRGLPDFLSQTTCLWDWEVKNIVKRRQEQSLPAQIPLWRKTS